MADIATLWDPPTGQGGWALDAAAGALVSGNDLETAILISLFTDRRADADDELPDGSGDRRGWWGDPQFGSKLWLRMRSKQTDALLALVRNDIAEALQWLIDDEIAARIDIEAEWTRPGLLGCRITVIRQDGTQSPHQFEWAWKDL